MSNRSLKALVPLKIRDALRPRYQHIRRSTVLARDRYRFPIPAHWVEARKRLGETGNTSELLAFAQREFGLIQIEEEILSFLEYAAGFEPLCVGEIGMKHGGTTLLLQHGIPGVECMVTLDVHLNNVGKLHYLRGSSQKVTCLEGNSHSLTTRRRVANVLSGQLFDLLFIEGDHTYEGVRQDYEMYRDLVRVGGLIVFHDIVADKATREGVPRTGNCFAGGVYRFWDEVKRGQEHREFVFDWSQDGFGIGALVHRTPATAVAKDG